MIITTTFKKLRYLAVFALALSSLSPQLLADDRGWRIVEFDGLTPSVSVRSVSDEGETTLIELAGDSPAEIGVYACDGPKVKFPTTESRGNQLLVRADNKRLHLHRRAGGLLSGVIAIENMSAAASRVGEGDCIELFASFAAENGRYTLENALRLLRQRQEKLLVGTATPETAARHETGEAEVDEVRRRVLMLDVMRSMSESNQ